MDERVSSINQQRTRRAMYHCVPHTSQATDAEVKVRYITKNFPQSSARSGGLAAVRAGKSTGANTAI